MLNQRSSNGHLALSLENERLRIGILPEKGADIFEIVYKTEDAAAEIQFLMQTPWGLKGPPLGPQVDFLDNYEGGWQELFPNANDSCEYRGHNIPFHGEVALLPWNFEVIGEGREETALRFWVDCIETPFRLERFMHLRKDENRFTIRERVSNWGSYRCDYVWGHHITLGGDFLEEGCLLSIPARNIYTPDALYEPSTARLEAGQTATWPFARTLRGDLIDLRYIPGPQMHSHDDVVLGGLERGVYRVVNPRLRLCFSLEWDSDVFPWLMFWQPYGGAELPPLTGIYGVGLEPWVSRFPLAKAVETGQARALEPREILETELAVEIQPG